MTTMTDPAPQMRKPSDAGWGPAGGESFHSYMQELRRLPLLGRDEEVELARRWREHGDREAARRLVVANLRFVVKVALGYRRYGVPLPDLIQEGNIGLMHAVERFDPDRGIRLISYAVWWIRAYIQSAVLRSWSLVRVGTTHAQRRLFYRLPAEVSSLAGEGEDAPGSELLARRLGVSAGEIEVMRRRLSGRDLSLDASWDDDSRAAPIERLADASADPEAQTADAEDLLRRRQRLRGALEQLSPRERAIVEQRHLTEQPRTLEELGDALGLSRERVRQIEAAALAKLRRTLASEREAA